MYLCVGVIDFACTKPRQFAVMFLCFRVIDFACTKPGVSGHVFRVIDFACAKPGE